AFFLTEAPQDIGFPAFHSSRQNLLYTCTLDKDLKIIAFFPIYDDRFHFIPISSNATDFALGDNFPFLFFRTEANTIEAINLNAIASNVDSFLENHKNNAFIRLQVARYFSEKDRSRAVRAISDAAEMFDLDAESKLSFISSETSLISSNKGVWEAIRPDVQTAATDDEIFLEFETLDKINAIQLLQSSDFKQTIYWPYLFLLYASKFGDDEFWFIVGKEYVRRLLLREALPAKIAVRVLNSVLGFHSNHMRRGQSPDRELLETIYDLIDTSVFDALSKLDPTLITKCLFLTLTDQMPLDAANALFDFIHARSERLPPEITRELMEELHRRIRGLDADDLGRFAGAVFGHSEEDREKLADLAQDRNRLQKNVLTRLTRGFATTALQRWG